MRTTISRAQAAMFVALLLLPAMASAQRVRDTAANYSAWNGSDTRNGGTGWGGAWSFSPASNTGNAGFFLGNAGGNASGTSSPGINDGSGNSFGFYANSQNTATATRSFASAMTAGETFSIRMDNGFINNQGENGGGSNRAGSVGFRLQNSSGGNIFEFRFVGGNSFYTYRIDDGTATNTSIGFTGGGLRLEFALSSGNNYTIRIFAPSTDTAADQTISGTFAGARFIQRLQLYNDTAWSSGGGSGDRDAFFNDIMVPEPSTAGLLLVGVGGLLARRRA